MGYDNHIVVRHAAICPVSVPVVLLIVPDHAPQQQQDFPAFFPPQPERIQRRKGLTDLHLDFKQCIIQLQLYGCWFNFFLDSPMASFIEAVNQKNSV